MSPKPAAFRFAQGGGDKMTPPLYDLPLMILASREIKMSSQNRVTARVPQNIFEKLQLAADLVGATLNQFIVQSALEKAEAIIERETTVNLSRQASLQIIDLIENPPPRNEYFLKAQERYRRMIDDGHKSS